MKPRPNPGRTGQGGECGQAVLELILALGLFSCVLTACAQFARLGAAHIQCQMAARRTAWLWNVWNTASLKKKSRGNSAPGAGLQGVAGGCGRFENVGHGFPGRKTGEGRRLVQDFSSRRLYGFGPQRGDRL